LKKILTGTIFVAMCLSGGLFYKNYYTRVKMLPEVVSITIFETDECELYKTITQKERYLRFALSGVCKCLNMIEYMRHLEKDLNEHNYPKLKNIYINYENQKNYRFINGKLIKAVEQKLTWMLKCLIQKMDFCLCVCWIKSFRAC